MPWDDRTPRYMEYPEPGFWMIKLVKRGPEVPAAIVLAPGMEERVGPPLKSWYVAFISGEPCAVDSVWFTRGREITRAEYDYQVADQRWCRENAPHLPKADPTVPIDPMKILPPF